VRGIAAYAVRSAWTSSALMLATLFSCSGGQSGKQTSFVKTCEQIQMVYLRQDGELLGTKLWCISPDQPLLPDGYSDGWPVSHARQP
jgi:hypothetical protein